MGGLFSYLFSQQPSSPVVSLPLPVLMIRAQYIGQPLATVLDSLRKRGIENIGIALKSRETWTPPPRKSTGRVYVLYSADSLFVQDVIYE